MEFPSGTYNAAADIENTPNTNIKPVRREITGGSWEPQSGGEWRGNYTIANLDDDSSAPVPKMVIGLGTDRLVYRRRLATKRSQGFARWACDPITVEAEVIGFDGNAYVIDDQAVFCFSEIIKPKPGGEVAVSRNPSAQSWFLRMLKSCFP